MDLWRSRGARVIMSPWANHRTLRPSAFTHRLSEEVGFIVDEKENSTKPKRTRVLRATDVIPPFDKLPDGADGIDREGPGFPAGPSSDSNTRGESDLTAGGTPDAGPPLVADAKIPKYDLAENILAEQRRVAARRRRSPSQAQPVAVSQSNGAGPSLAELPSDDLPELQRIVAEIVARDIDRLCRRPTR